MKYRSLFYHASWGDKKWIDNAIALTTQAYNLWRILNPVEWAIVKMGLSHEEIWIPKHIPSVGSFYVFHELNSISATYLGTCYTATLGQTRSKNAEGENGTRVADACDVLKNPWRWSYIEHDVPLWRFDAMMAYLNNEVHKNLGYGLGPKKNICSEVSHNASVAAGVLKGPRRIVSPLVDAILLTRAGGELKPLIKT